MNVQAPPNLTPEAYAMLLLAGINDWGGVSPVTPDHINPEAPWPEIEVLARRSAEVGYTLRERLTLYPEFITPDSGFVPDALRGAVVRLADAEGYAPPEQLRPAANFSSKFFLKAVFRIRDRSLFFCSSGIKNIKPFRSVAYARSRYIFMSNTLVRLSRFGL